MGTKGYLKKENIINFILYLIILIMPLIVINFSDYPRYVMGKVFFLYAANIIAIIISIIKNDFYIEKEHKIIMIFLVTIFIAFVFSPYKEVAFTGSTERNEGFSMFLVYTCLFFLASRYLKITEKSVHLILIVGSFSAIYGMLQFYGIDPIQKWALNGISVANSIGTIGNRNFFSSYIVLFLSLSTALYIFKEKIIYLCYTLILFAGLVCSLTRGGWLGYGVVLVFIFIFSIISKKRKSRILKMVAMAVCFIVIGGTLNSTTDGSVTGRVNNLKEQITTTDEEVKAKSSASSRVDILNMTLKAFKDRPLLGTGPDTLGNRLYDDYPIEMNNHISTYGQSVDKAHNEYLEYATSCGIFTLISYLTLVIMIGIKLIKRRKEEKYIIILMPIIGYLAQAVTNISVPMVAPLFWILLGYAVQEIYLEKNNTLKEVYINDLNEDNIESKS
ncbi:MAG: O-antigen ligase family protein [Clostridium sp.]|jgi:putative inorganic carbon (HCO3(-)) transporter|nr:O-antigen ligase family protein [Clostridium sp.]